LVKFITEAFTSRARDARVTPGERPDPTGAQPFQLKVLDDK
jgi:hypothetical protein